MNWKELNVQSFSYIESLYNERDKTKSSAYVQEYINNFLNKEPIPGIEFEYNLYKQYLPTITLNEVNTLIKSWIKPTDRSVIVMAPDSEKKNLVTQTAVLALLNKPLGKLTPYEDKTVKGAILASTPTPGRVTATETVPELGVTKLILSNGATVILKPTDFKNNEILFLQSAPVVHPCTAMQSMHLQQMHQAWRFMVVSETLIS